MGYSPSSLNLHRTRNHVNRCMLTAQLLWSLPKGSIPSRHCRQHGSQSVSAARLETSGETFERTPVPRKVAMATAAHVASRRPRTPTRRRAITIALLRRADHACIAPSRHPLYPRSLCGDYGGCRTSLSPFPSRRLYTGGAMQFACRRLVASLTPLQVCSITLCAQECPVALISDQRAGRRHQRFGGVG